jgi:predicted membrane protein
MLNGNTCNLFVNRAVVSRAIVRTKVRYTIVIAIVYTKVFQLASTKFNVIFFFYPFLVLSITIMQTQAKNNINHNDKQKNALKSRLIFNIYNPLKLFYSRFF